LGSGITVGFGLLKGLLLGALSGLLTGVFTGAVVVDIFFFFLFLVLSGQGTTVPKRNMADNGQTLEPTRKHDNLSILKKIPSLATQSR